MPPMHANLAAVPKEASSGYLAVTRDSSLATVSLVQRAGGA
jgi:hypothetical protein